MASAVIEKHTEPSAATAAEGRPECFHCGEVCVGARHQKGDRHFCCQGCLLVHELLTDHGLSRFYELAGHPGMRTRAGRDAGEWAYLDDAALAQRLVDYTDERLTHITFHIPAIHCIACVWLLENLFQLNPAIGRSQVNFGKREVTIQFATAKLRLSELVALLGSIGYEPRLTLGGLEERNGNPLRKRQWQQIGVVGFAFGNIMLFNISTYLGLDIFSGPFLRRMFGFLSVALSVPVVCYSAADYWRAAWVSLRRARLSIEVPIAIGIAALALRSTYEVVSGAGEGYFDSLSGLLFFLLCGRLFQDRTYDRLAFDLDYRSFFPLSARRKRGTVEEHVSLGELRTGDHLVIRSGELIPADARLVEGSGLVDYSFVTGESEPVQKAEGDYLYAGGRQIGGALEVETVKAVSQSYLTSLWNHEAFRKERGETFGTLTNRYSKRFTLIVIGVALVAGAYWWRQDPGLGLKAFTSVLIVACPCALALAAPFALGTAQRVLAGRQAFVKNGEVIETLARVDTIVFDKTGTLTAAGAAGVIFHGQALTGDETRRIRALASHSTHPYCARLCETLSVREESPRVHNFSETPGCGIEAQVEGCQIRLGSAPWFVLQGLAVPVATPGNLARSVVHVAIEGTYRGCFLLDNTLRPGAGGLIRELSGRYELCLLSGDHERERERFTELFGEQARLHFNQSPLNKLGFIRDLQAGGGIVMMVGDGLNDAGALRQSDAGVAVVEKVGAFSPASDVILSAGMVPRLGALLRFARGSVRVVRLSFLISSLYNVLGISIAASGRLSPIVCAILMPLSSATVVTFACGATAWLGRGLGPDGLSGKAIVANKKAETVQSTTQGM